MEAAHTNRPQIDGLRAFAVAGVLLTHFWIDDSAFGHLGVRMFFVISGLLITGILLDARQQAAESGLGKVLGTFYVRRVLRIFPAYYAALLGAYILNLGDVRQTILWHAGYLSNVLFTLRGSWGWATAHLWTLSVEEQFYIIWPFVILLTPRSRFSLMIGITIVCSLLFRSFYFGRVSEAIGIWIATPAAFDALGAGALLAVWFRSGGWLPSERILRLLLLPALGIAALSYLLSPKDYYIWGEFLWLVPIVVLVGGASIGFSGMFARVLEAAPALYLGKISYGIYLYHVFVWVTAIKLTEKVGVSFISERGFITFTMMSAATIGVAAASWRFYEGPINKLKKRYAYATAGLAAKPTGSKCSNDLEAVG